MSVDVFDITVSQLEDFASLAHEDLDAYACIDKYMVLTTWCLFGNPPTVCMIAYGPTADEEMALRYACRLDYNDLCANRMSISRIGNHYEVWHVVDNPTPALVDDIEPEPVDWFDELGDTLGEDYSECIETYEYIRAIDEMF